ncbi:transcriptional regulator, LacI family [Alkalithermobacter thermoalcaliphilus JW-YL-7 = DSM 7308]|uniref:Transcriptional regulator, LacI family n=1 Tax=Alkalithermobacter thermoalcaliphilus JW-YL-7 = DSM 7308 TaxID=1121328 RepID=A0A150FR77_CLOPD|nr:transcriptional regulator, LacI family [[Clostridium] paradoxum JW-YL-7 = DSM 7308]SHK63648.1 transcriptional regulator, LacI family [[Clostridium] paradoxum JW-YL-7 = DSM 7308]
MKLTIKDIARLAGVSTTTVSKIINNKHDSISKDTTEKVIKIMKDNNYVPSTIARSLVTKKTKTIGLIIPDIVNPFFPELARGAEDKANKEGYNLIICNTDEDIQKEDRYVAMLVEKMVDGIIFTASSQRVDDFKLLKNANIPIVLVDRDVKGSHISSKITVDNFMGAYEGTKHLIEQGYKKIIFITGSLKNKTSLDRLNGYKKALDEHNIKFSYENVIEGSYKSEWGYNAVNFILKQNKNFDALFCGNDLIAIGAIKALKENDIKIPQDVGVLGFDDIYISRIIDPQLTTIKQPIYEMGYKSVQTLIDILEKKSKKVKDIVLVPKLVIRSSTVKG